MVRYNCGVAVFAILIVLFTPSLGRCSVQQENQEVLAKSKIKKNSFKKKILQRVKKSLPKQQENCPIVVTDIKLLRADDEFDVAEEWTVNVCQSNIVYFVRTSDWPKGYWISDVMLKEERITFEKGAVAKYKVLMDDENFIKGFYYLKEIFTDEELKKIQGQ